MSRTCPRFALLLAALLFVATNLCGQVATGTPPFGSFSGGPFDIVNNANLNVHLPIPVRVKAGRGMPFSYVLSYDSSVWYPSGGVWVPVTNWGWRGITEIATGYVTYMQTQAQCFWPQNPSGHYYYFNIYHDWYYHDSLGAIHYFGGAVSGYSTTPCQGGQFPPYYATFTAPDGSGYTMSASANPSATVYDRSGKTIQAPLQMTSGSGSATDPNGNQISVSANGGTTTFTDTLGKTALTVSGSGTPSSPITFTWTNPQGTASSISLNYGSAPYTVETNFACTGVTDYGRSQAVTQNLVSSISTPEGSYQIAYEATVNPNHAGAVTGRIHSITLPTGGTITYEYSGGSGSPTTNAITCADGSAATLKRYTPDTGTNYWQYAHSENATAWTTTITDPNNKATIINFQTIYETSRQLPDSLGSVTTCYNGNTTNCDSTAITLPITQRTATTLIAGLTSKTDTLYNTYGLPTEVDEYNYGASTPTRKRIISYANIGGYVSDRVSQIQIQTGSGAMQAQADFGYDSHGNLLTDTRSTGGTPATISRSFAYSSSGVLQTATDFNSHTTTYTNNGCTNSFPTTISLPVSLSIQQTWDCDGGVLESVTEPNTQTTDLSYDDNLWRLTKALLPPVNGNRGWSLIQYSSATQRDFYTGLTDTTPAPTCTGCRHDQIDLDGLARVKTSSLVNDPDGQTYVDTAYDSLGRIASVSNPYRPPPSGGDTYAYDALNRVSKVTHADATYAQIGYGSGSQGCSYSTYGLGYPATSTDEAGKQRRIFTDALGRVIEVDEPDSNGALTVNTCYAYDLLDNLRQVVEGGQTRAYAYDKVSRLTSAQTPESNNLTTYFYYTDAGGSLCAGDPSAVCRRTDARNITTTYTYDALNRLTSKTYSDGTPAASFFYDESSVTLNGTVYTLTNTKGRLSHSSAAGGTAITIHSYDTTGRIKDYWQCTPYNCASATVWHGQYAYDLAGDVTSWVHPASITLTNSISTAQRVTHVTSSWVDSSHPATLATFSYTPFGAIDTLTDGCVPAGSCTPLQEKYTYNNRLQPVMVQVGTATAPSSVACDVYYYYTGFTSPSSCPTTAPGSGSGNNGNVMGWYHWDGDPWGPGSGVLNTTNYVYDALNRLQRTYMPNHYSQTYNYDRYGNMGCAPGSDYCNTTITFDPATNHINTNSSWTYDAAGNLTQDGTGYGTHTFQWDGEGRLKSVDSGATASFVYNALGQRVEKQVGSAYTEILYDAFGNVSGYHNRTAWVQDFIPLGSRIFAKYQDGVTYYLHGNPLGSTQVVMRADNTYAQAQNFFSFGGLRWSGGGTLDVRFASMQERDLESTSWQDPLDPTPNRTYTSGLGRWLSPDPLAGDVTNPQSLNRYAYVLNNPASMIDPLGLQYDQNNHPVGCTNVECVWQRWGWARYPGFSDASYAQGECVVDGIAAPCGFVLMSIQNGSASLCLNSDCTVRLSGNSIENWVPPHGPPGDVTPGYWDEVGTVAGPGFSWWGTASTIGPALPAATKKAVFEAQHLSYLDSIIMRLSCWAGQEPGMMAPAGNESSPQDSTHAPETTEQQKTLYGPDKRGGQVPLNPNGAGSQVPATTQAAASYLSRALGCIADVWAWYK